MPKDRSLMSLENIQATFKYYDLPALSVLATKEDRAFFYPEAAFWFDLDILTTDGKFDQWDFVQNHGSTSRRGWREAVAFCSLQIIDHGGLVECDFDIGNPNFGLLPALIHLIEVIIPRKTSPSLIRKGLRKRGIITST